jgi:hypothetical protein
MRIVRRIKIFLQMKNNLVLNKEETEQKDQNSLLEKKNHKKIKRPKEEEIVKQIANQINLIIILSIRSQMVDAKIIEKATMKIIITKEEEVAEEIENFPGKMMTNIKVETNVGEGEVEEEVVTATIIIKIHKETTIIIDLTQTIIKLMDKEISKRSQLTNKNNRVKLDPETIIMSMSEEEAIEEVTEVEEEEDITIIIIITIIMTETMIIIIMMVKEETIITITVIIILIISQKNSLKLLLRRLLLKKRLLSKSLNKFQ